MPERKRERRVQSGPVQGDDSFVILRAPTMRQAESIGNNWSEWTNDQRIEALVPIIAGWNWVDDDGAPLPQAVDEPGIILDLTPSEIRFIIDALVNPDTKN